MTKMQRNTLAFLTSFLVTVALLMLLSGCETVSNFIQDNERTARVTVTYATLKVIRGEEERKQRVIEITQEALKYAHSTAYLTVDSLIAAIRAEINWNNLDDADTLLVNELLYELDARLTEHFQGDEIPAVMVITLDTVGGWVIDAANMARTDA